jgi:hypothetical protein
MKKMLLMACTLLALSAGMAYAGAGGLNLGWADCEGLPATLNRTSTCTSNTGLINTLVGSFVAPSCVTAMSANEVVLDLQSLGATVPLWWQMRTGTCRAGSLGGNFDFTGGPFTCFDYWQGGAIGALQQDPIGLSNTSRIKGVFALPAGDSRITGIPEGTEVYSFKANINNAKSTGLGACSGCPVGVCIVLNSIKINQPVDQPCGGKFVSAPASRNFATWQGGIGGDCLAATPAKNTTWGSVKALYR